jgi:hypothetical protein
MNLMAILCISLHKELQKKINKTLILNTIKNIPFPVLPEALNDVQHNPESVYSNITFLRKL